MTDFSHTPIKSIKIHQMVRMTFEEFKDRMLQLPSNTHVKYIDGVVFIQYTPRETDEVIAEELQGHLHWTYLEFAKVDKKPEPIADSYVKIPVFDVSKHQTFIDFLEWLKKQEIWNDK